MLAPGAEDASVLPEEGNRARLDHDLRTGLRGLPSEEPIEQVSLEDVAAFVPGPGLVEDQGRAVGRDDPRTVDLVTNELPARREPDLLEPAFRDPFAAPDGRTNLGSFLNQEDVGPAEGGVLRRGAPGRTRAHDEDIDLAVHLLRSDSVGTHEALGGFDRNARTTLEAVAAVDCRQQTACIRGWRPWVERRTY